MAGWDEQYRAGQGRYFPNEELIRFLGRTYGSVTQRKARGLTAIDIGAGVGGNMWALTLWGFYVVGLESSEVAIQLGVEHAKRQGFEYSKEYRYYKAPGCIHLPAKSVQLVVDIQTVQHLTEEEHMDMYAEIYRVLSPGGRFFSVHWSCDDDKAVDAIFPVHPELKKCKAYHVSRLLRGAGFDVNSSEYMSRTYYGEGQVATWNIAGAVKA